MSFDCSVSFTSGSSSEPSSSHPIEFHGKIPIPPNARELVADPSSKVTGAGSTSSTRSSSIAEGSSSATRATTSSSSNSRSHALSRVNRAAWTAELLRKHPEVLSLADSTRALSHADALTVPTSRSDLMSTTAVKDLLSRDLILSLIWQHLSTLGYNTTLKVLQEESRMTYSVPSGDVEGSKLLPLLYLAVRDTERLFDPESDKQLFDEDPEVSPADYRSMEEEIDENQNGTDTNLWDDWEDTEENIVWSERTQEDSHMESLSKLKLASLNKLVERLTVEQTSDTTAQLKFQKTFLMTYRSFTTPAMLLTKLIQRYHVPRVLDPSQPPLPEAQWKKTKQLPIQLRVCNTIKTWMQDHYADFNDALNKRLQTFLDTDVARNNLQLAKLLRNLLSTKIEGRSKKIEQQMSSTPPDPKIPKNIFSTSLSFMDIDSEEMARQITLMDATDYKAIQPSELLNLAWSKPKLQYRSPHVLAMTRRFNQLSGWIAWSIVSEPRIKQRIKVYAKLVEIMYYLRQLNNFNGVMAFISGFGNAAVTRLKFTKEELPQKTKDHLAELQQLMSTSQSFKTYRNMLHFINPPCVPFLGIYLTDLTFIEDGNKDSIGQLINFFKRRLIYEIIFEIKQYQQDMYNLVEVYQILQYIRQCSGPGEKETFDASLLAEPRGADRSDLQ